MGGAKKSGHLDYPFKSYGPKQVRLISTHPWTVFYNGKMRFPQNPPKIDTLYYHGVK